MIAHLRLYSTSNTLTNFNKQLIGTFQKSGDMWTLLCLLYSSSEFKAHFRLSKVQVEVYIFCGGHVVGHKVDILLITIFVVVSSPGCYCCPWASVPESTVH